MDQSFSIIFNNFTEQSHSFLYQIADRHLSEQDVSETQCRIGYTISPDCIFGRNYIEIITPGDTASAEIIPVVQAGLGTASQLQAPVIIRRGDGKPLILPRV